MGRLMRNTDPHQKNSSSTPETMGPMAMATMNVEAHTAMAMLRSRTLEKLMRIRARVAGSMSAPPAASSARAAISTSGFGE